MAIVEGGRMTLSLTGLQELNSLAQDCRVQKMTTHYEKQWTTKRAGPRMVHWEIWSSLTIIRPTKRMTEWLPVFINEHLRRIPKQAYIHLHWPDKIANNDLWERKSDHESVLDWENQNGNVCDTRWNEMTRLYCQTSIAMLHRATKIEELRETKEQLQKKIWIKRWGQHILNTVGRSWRRQHKTELDGQPLRTKRHISQVKRFGRQKESKAKVVGWVHNVLL